MATSHEKIRVCYVTHSTNSLAGSAKALLAIIQQVMAQGVEPLVITNDHEGIYKEWCDLGIPTLALDYRQAVYPPVRNLKDVIFFLPRTLGRLWLEHKASASLAAVLRRERIDLVHTNTSVVSIGQQAAAQAHVPHVYHFREYGDAGLGMHYMPSWAIFHRRARKTHSICITRGIMQHHFPKGNPRATVIYDGVMPTQDEPALHARKDYFLFAGRIEPVKGLDFLLEGYAHYVRQTAVPLKLRIAGGVHDLAYHSRMQSFIHDAGIAEHVEFIGPRNDLFLLMREAAALVVTSEFEGFGFCLAEAMFNGCLTIGRDTTGTREQFDNGLAETGHEIGLRCKTPKELGARLAEVHALPAEAFLDMRQRAFRVVNKLYTSEGRAQQILATYRRIIGEQQ